MPWYQVVIEKDKPAADMEAEALMKKFGPAYRNAGLPESAKAYRCQTPSGGYIFYFNPAAALVATEIFPLFSASECSEVPDLEGCKLIRF